MILQTGMRTDIPAFYSRWFLNRLREGFVLVRNPYDPQSVTRYRLDPSVVDLIGFCSKNPAPMLPHLETLRDYGQYWFVTITPYGRDLEPHVPGKEMVMEDFKRLSDAVGPDSVGWRYDPILVNEQYPVERHIRDFEHMAKTLSGYTESCVISFLDLYEKVKRNFPEAREVRKEDRIKTSGAGSAPACWEQTSAPTTAAAISAATAMPTAAGTRCAGISAPTIRTPPSCWAFPCPGTRSTRHARRAGGTISSVWSCSPPLPAVHKICEKTSKNVNG